MEIGVLIKKYRESANLTQKQLASLSATSQNTISRIESGKQSPAFCLLLRIVKSLNAEVIIYQKITKK